MIGYIEGQVMKVVQDGILLLAGQIGYEILLPVVNFEAVSAVDSEETLSLHIYYYQTERQPKPVLIGFHSEEEKAFFQLFITVDAIGPLKAVKAMERPVGEIARAIESKDIAFLSGLKGIGKRTAQKIVAALHGKVSQFVTAVAEGGAQGETTREGHAFVPTPDVPEISQNMKAVSQQVVDVLVEQLGYTAAVARRMVGIALENNHSILTPEQLFDAVLQQR